MSRTSAPASTGHSSFPLAERGQLGYQPEEVDAFLERARDTYDQGADVLSPVTALEIRGLAFPLKKRGYSARFVDAAMDRHDIHVAASRARGEVRLFVDRASVDAVVRSERALTDRMRPVEDAERQGALARALSRSGEKASTLDYGVEAEAFVDIPADRPSLQQEEERSPTTANVRSRRRSRDRGLGLDV